MSEGVRRSKRKDHTDNSLIVLSYVVLPLDNDAQGDPVVPKGYEDPFRGCFNQRPLSTAPAGLTPEQIEADLRAMRQGVYRVFAL